MGEARCLLLRASTHTKASSRSKSHGGIKAFATIPLIHMILYFNWHLFQFSLLLCTCRGAIRGSGTLITPSGERIVRVWRENITDLSLPMAVRYVIFISVTFFLRTFTHVALARDLIGFPPCPVRYIPKITRSRTPRIVLDEEVQNETKYQARQNEMYQAMRGLQLRYARMLVATEPYFSLFLPNPSLHHYDIFYRSDISNNKSRDYVNAVRLELHNSRMEEKKRRFIEMEEQMKAQQAKLREARLNALAGDMEDDDNED